MTEQSTSKGWLADELHNPHQSPDKASKVRAMFAAIAHAYDLNNRLHSFGRDQSWRRRAVKLAQVQPGDVVLDVACGTGDLAMQFSRSGAQSVLGLDFTFEMLELAQRKKPSSHRAIEPSREEKKSPVENQKPQASCYSGGKPQTFLTYTAADALRLPVNLASVNVVSIAFGLRNVSQPALALAEFYRVLIPGGRLIVLEFSQPANPLLRRLSGFYCRRIMPRTAAWIARDRVGAYRYLPSSVDTFATRQDMLQMMGAAGFTGLSVTPLTFGIAVIYRGFKSV